MISASAGRLKNGGETSLDGVIVESRERECGQQSPRAQRLEHAVMQLSCNGMSELELTELAADGSIASGANQQRAPLLWTEG